MKPSAGKSSSPLLRSTAVWLAITIFIISESQVAAQDQKPQRDLSEASLEELMKIEVASVYSASKYFQKVTEAPSSVSIITSEEIQRYGYRTLADALRSVRGFCVTYDRNYSYLGVRGLARPGDYNTRVLLLIDGHRLNDNIYDGSLFGTEFPVDVDLIERVEIVRGPSSSLYGTSAFFAVINVITKRGGDAKGLMVSTEAASLGTHKGQISYGNKFDNSLELLFSISYYNSRGQRHLFYREFDDPATNNGIAEQADDDRTTKFFAELAYREFILRGAFSSRQKGIPTAAFGTVFNDARTRTTDQRGYLDLRYEHAITSQLQISARVYSDLYRYYGTYVYDYSTDNTPLISLNKDLIQGDWWGGELLLTKTLLRKHKLTAGTEYRDNFRQNLINYDVDPYARYLDNRRESKNVGVYLQNEFAIRENVNLSVGLRHDYHTIFGGTTKPRLGLIYHPAPKMAIKLLYGEAFRAPSNHELVYSPSEINNPNLALKPETIKTTELVVEKYLKDRIRLSASGYLYRINGLIARQIAPTEAYITYKNAGRVESKGFEFEIETRLAGGLEGRLGYTLQDSRDRETKQTLTNSPKHLAKFNLSVPLIKQRILASLELQYTSERRTLAGSDAPAFWLSNFNLFSQKLMKGLNLSFGVYNLFDQKYGDPGSSEHRQNTIEQDGRNLRLKLTYRF